MLFNQNIHNLEDWGRIFQNKAVFEPLVKDIFQKNGMEFSGIDNCTPGSNAVFRAGKYIVKIFAPEESEIGGESDYITEKFGIARANQLHIAAPMLFASGVIEDKYTFRYLILEYIEGESLADISKELSEAERFRVGQALRDIVTRMDTGCEAFNSHALFGKAAEERWKAFPTAFQRERKAYLQTHSIEKGVYVHGDLNPDNIIVNANREIYIIDFADALIAPIELELAGIICDGFHFDSAYLHGFLGEYEKEELAERLLYGLLIHDYGVNIIRDNIGKPDEIHSLMELRERIVGRVQI